MSTSRVTERVGQVLGGRYRLLALVGTGASASVYLADDLRLERQVAVKVLHDALADDEAFLRRFRAEAKAVAALSHPNILAVHDWGEERGVPFLVTEYLGGGSLRALLDRGHRLTPPQALLVGLETARGLEYAHRHGLVHRDVKPANLLFDDEGRLRIADFGLARALAEAAWTEPMGAVLGSARYASPEQARGERLDGRSDVYSLALVVVEAITGEVPFAADTTIGTLMGRIDRPLPVPEDIGPLGPILQAAGTPEPSLRPDAAEFGAALLQAATDYDRPPPLPLRSAVVAPDVPVVPATTVLDDLVVLADDTAVLPVPAGGSAPPATSDVAPPADATAVAAIYDADLDADLARTDPALVAGRRRRWPLVLAIVVVLGLVGAASTYWWVELRIPKHPVPEVVALPAVEAEARLTATGWVVDQTQTYRDATTAGIVLEQRPAPGTELREGEAVTLVVSLGPPPVEVPTDLAGLPLADATAALERAGLVVGEVTRTFDEAVAADHVIALTDAETEVIPKGSPVGLVVSDGPAPRTVPTLAGTTPDEAETALAGLVLEIELVEQFSDDVEAGVVIGSEPGPGSEVPRGSTVRVAVSKGPDLVTVPDVAGSSVTEAAAALEEAGLVVRGTEGSPSQEVAGTDPPAGTEVRRGSEVSIRTGEPAGGADEGEGDGGDGAAAAADAAPAGASGPGPGRRATP